MATRKNEKTASGKSSSSAKKSTAKKTATASVVYDQVESLAADWGRKYQFDLVKMSQNQFNALCQFIGKSLYPKDKYNSLDYETAETAFNNYIQLVDCLDKIATPESFAYFLNVDISTPYKWIQGTSRGGSEKFKILGNNLIKLRELGASNKLLGGSNVQVVGLLGYLNHFAGWNAPNMAGNEQQQAVRLSRAEALEISQNQPAELLPTDSPELPKFKK